MFHINIKGPKASRGLVLQRDAISPRRLLCYWAITLVPSCLLQPNLHLTWRCPNPVSKINSEKLTFLGSNIDEAAREGLWYYYGQEQIPWRVIIWCGLLEHPLKEWRENLGRMSADQIVFLSLYSTWLDSLTASHYQGTQWRRCGCINTIEVISMQGVFVLCFAFRSILLLIRAEKEFVQRHSVCIICFSLQIKIIRASYCSISLAVSSHKGELQLAYWDNTASDATYKVHSQSLWLVTTETRN